MGMITAEVALYPQKTQETSKIINSSIQAINKGQVKYEIKDINTRITGSINNVFNNLKTIFDKAEKESPEVNMVVTITNSAKNSIM